MSAFALTTVTLSDGVERALALVPAAAGVGQILAQGDRNLVIGRPANLRKWAAGHLGRARLPKAVPGKLPPRPPTDLTPIATAIAYLPTTSPFGQRLAYERVMARHVPLSKRRDLKRPGWLRLDPRDGYPHLVVQPSAEGPDVFGPFRDTRAATRARDAVYKHFRIRPCDFDFKPASGLAETLPADVARALGGSTEIADVPAWVRSAGGRSLVADHGRGGIEIYPIAGGAVVDAAVAMAPLDDVERAVAALTWPDDAPSQADTPWLNVWRHGKRTGVEIRVLPADDAPAIAARIREVVG